MKNLIGKAVILNNPSSPYIYQAIVILNERGMINESKALEDAEKIVSEYLAKNKADEGEDILLYSHPPKSSRGSRLLKPLFYAGVFSVTLFLGFILFRK